MTTALFVDDSVRSALSDRLRHVIGLHFDPAHGSAYWLQRQEAAGLDVRAAVREIEDLGLLGDMTPADLRDRPLLDFIPRCLHARRRDLVIGQTGGLTGTGAWTAYGAAEFEDAFVTPFTQAADHVGFPRGQAWLYAGPSGPHIIGKAARRLAASLDSPDPFSVDFDPRWARTLAAGSFAQQRYLEHVVEQARDVLATQHIGVLFTTPAVLERLVEAMTAEQRARIRGVHYGGMALAPEALGVFRAALPQAVHLSGYGNTLAGCCLELDASWPRHLDYYPHGTRLVLEIVNDEGQPLPVGASGRVRITRLDESMLLVRMVERDVATRLSPPVAAPQGFVTGGLRDPHSPVRLAGPAPAGLY